MSKRNINGKGIAPPFYLLMFMIAIVGLGYMMLTGVPENNLGIIAVSLIFGFLFLSGLVISLPELSLSRESMTTSSIGLVIGFFGWLSLTSLSNVSSFFSLFSFPTQSTLATIQEQISPFWAFINTVIMAPIIEELFWAMALPIAVFVLMRMLSEEITIFGNQILQFIVVIIIASSTFAFFHTSSTLVSFFISAMLFRTIQVVLFYGDRLYDFIPNYSVPLSLLIGAHIANNLSIYGVINAYNILLSNIFGWIILLIFISIFALGIRGIIISLTKR